MSRSATDDALAAQVVAFADTLDNLVSECLPDTPGITVVESGTRYEIAPSGQTGKHGGVPLSIKGEVLAWLRFTYLCRMDAPGQFLAIDKSKIWIVADVDRTPLVRSSFCTRRTEFRTHTSRSTPNAALSHLLSKAGHASPHQLSALHLPTGGARFRPGLEDVLQFLVTDCGFESVVGWRDAVDRERAAWRVIQTRSVVRAMADVAAAQLESMGYEVTPPPDGHPPRGAGAQRNW